MKRASKNISWREMRQKARHGFWSEAYPKGWRSTGGRGHRVAAIVQRVREHFDKPVFIVSAYRSIAYNRKIGSSDRSQHPRGTAIDFVVRGVSATRVHAWVLKQYRLGNMPELGGLGRYPRFTHVDVRDRRRLGRLARWSGSRGSRGSRA